MTQKKTLVPKEALEKAWHKPHTGGSTRKKLEDQYKNSTSWSVEGYTQALGLREPYKYNVLAKNHDVAVDIVKSLLEQERSRSIIVTTARVLKND